MGRYFPDLPSRQIAQMGDVDDNPVHLCAEEEFWTVAKIAFLWGRSSGSSGEHPKGLALDFSVLEYGGGVSNPGPARYWMGNKIANWLWANRARLGVWYVIWNRRIISSNRHSYAYNRWVEYRGSNPHTDHVHVSYYSANIYQPPITVPDPIEPPTEDTLSAAEVTELKDHVTTEVNRQADALNTDLSTKLTNHATNIEDHVTRRTQGRVNEADMARFGFDKGLYQAGALASKGAVTGRANAQTLAQISEVLLRVAEAVTTPMSDEERQELAREIAAEVDKLRVTVDVSRELAASEPEEIPDDSQLG